MAEEKMIIVMELADCGDVFKLIKNQILKKKFFSESKILNWFIQITCGLQYLHKRNILHRDLKTKNIFLTSQNLIKIGDFGISKTLNHTLDLANTGIGTPHYLSPEMCNGQPYNLKSDIWSLGTNCFLHQIRLSMFKVASCTSSAPWSWHTRQNISLG